MSSKCCSYCVYIQVSIQWQGSNSRPVPSVQNDDIRILALPPPPSPVRNVTLSNLAFPDENIKFTFQWSPPATTNGQLTEYTVCLGGRQLLPFEDHDPLNVAASDENDTNCETIPIVRSTYI